MSGLRMELCCFVFAAALLGLAACDDSTNGSTSNADGDQGSALRDGGGGTIDLPFDKCAGVTEVAKNTYAPVDIVFTIDNTPSLEDEIAAVRANMNKFSQMIQDRGLDAHIVVISCLPGDCDNDKFFGICIDPPVGKTGGCTGPVYDDSNPPNYLHVSERVPSTKGLETTITTMPQWISMMRSGATRHVVIVSDDTDEWTAAQFNDALVQGDAGFADYTFHGIFSYKSKEDACAIATTEPCCTYAAPAGEGVPYKELVALTGGVSGDLCLQDFDPVFDQIATSVIAGAKLSCEWEIPAPPDGEELNPNLVNVQFVPATGTATVIGRVDSAADCANTSARAWYYDNATSPTKILVCPDTCSWIQADATAEMHIAFGCKTEIAPIE